MHADGSATGTGGAGQASAGRSISNSELLQNVASEFVDDLADQLQVSKSALLIIFVGIFIALAWVLVPCLCRFATGTGVIEQKVQKVTREMQVVETQLERIEDRQQNFEARVDEQMHAQTAQLQNVQEGLGQVLSKMYEQSNKLDKMTQPRPAQAQSQT